MLKIEKTVLPSPDQWEMVIEGTRNPKNSWDRMDSYCGFLEDESPINPCDELFYFIGENDSKLMMSLAKAGTEHSKYRRMIPVWVTINAPLYWWPEFDAYKVGTVANSCSKMHRLLHKPFEMSDFSFDKLPGYKREIKQFRPEIDEEREVWLKLDADYDVSSQGRVRHGSRIMSGSLHQDGYIFVTVHGQQKPVHRLVAELFIANYEKKPEVNHKDGNKQNNFAENLEWVTRSENQKHAVDNGLQPKGMTNYKGKFTDEQRKAIKEEWDSGKISRRAMAKKYGVSHTCINDILNDKYKYAGKVNLFEDVARPIVDMLNELRDSYFACEDEEEKKQIWYSILSLLPESYNQKRTVMLNYEVLANMYRQRKNHKLSEWHTFCYWIKTLPYSELITMEE
jgi:hypothetical protein